MSFSKLLIVLLLIRVDSLDLIGAPDFNLGAVAAHIIRVLAVLREAVCKSSPDTGLSQ